MSDVTGTAFSDRLYGTIGNNVFAPGAGSDFVYGNGGSDTLDYSSAAGGIYADLASGYVYESDVGQSWFSGSASIVSTDYVTAITNVTGSAFGDRLYGPTSGSATLSGGDGADIIFGKGGGNTELGGNGNDRLIASGNDIMTGGSGSDRFYFVSLAQGSNTVTDFASGSDSLWFNSGQFGSYTSGQSPSLYQGTGTTDQIYGAQTTGGFAYNTTTGGLYFDADGSGGSFSATLVATLSGAPTLAASDLYIN